MAQVHCDSELFEIELSTSPSCVNVKGNLRRSLEFWKCIGTPSFIFNITEMGYLFPSFSFPEPAVFKNNRSSLSHLGFVDEAIQDLVESGCVVENNGKRRLVLDLSYVNNSWALLCAECRYVFLRSEKWVLSC